MPLFKETEGIPALDADENVSVGRPHLADPFVVGLPTGEHVTADRSSQNLIRLSKLRHKTPGQLIGPGTRDFNPDTNSNSNQQSSNHSSMLGSILQKIKLT